MEEGVGTAGSVVTHVEKRREYRKEESVQIGRTCQGNGRVDADSDSIAASHAA